MLSNPPISDLHARQRQHRRQNSTPTPYENVKIAPNLAKLQHHNVLRTQQQRARLAHRRGMSLDARQAQFQAQQDFPMVSNTNNTGLANTPQHVVREAQQQRIARPGPQQAYENYATGDNYLVSPNATPQMPSFGQSWCDGLPVMTNDLHMSFDMYSGSMNNMAKKDHGVYSSGLSCPDFDAFPSSGLSTPTFIDFQEDAIGTPGWVSETETASSRRNSRRISNGIMDRVNKFEHMANEQSSQPLTPARQNEADYFPLTPMQTPNGGTMKRVHYPQRFAEGYDESNEVTVKPVRQRGLKRPPTVFDDMRQSVETQRMEPGMQRSNTMPTAKSNELNQTNVPAFLSFSHPHANGLSIDTRSDGFGGPAYPMSAASDYSQHVSPATPNLARYGSFDYVSSPHTAASSPSPHKSSKRSSQHRRTDSIASQASAASIASIDIEKTKTETGITLDDIQQYIQGPDPVDNKWICSFEDCNKKFGRKENIKSHVQTHLNDRQFQCPACLKCFVRQHDLKRHAKIHTGIRPYPCECGNSFARHDALTRHRQRGMCIGAFEGSTPKNAKRGRPRKERPNDDERREKATRTRRKTKSVSSVSSQTSQSDYSSSNSPEQHDNDFDMMDDMMDVSLGGTTMNPSSLQTHGSSTAPMPALAMDDPLTAPSPSTASVHSYASQLSQMTLHSDMDIPPTGSLPRHPGSPTLSITSPANDPPELSHISSPPATQFFDSEPNSSGLDLMISSAAEANTSGLSGMVAMAPSDGDGDLFSGHDPQMLLFDGETKFDDSYDGVGMFTHNADLILGNP
ncbi:hypothetical protein GGS20DRAFT_544926 [Poronia punctata]|nr:hypothetical protein GGS20DRAFT_544926 [Poronia punctata]